MDNLAKNAMAALQSNMSYGKWKALHPVTIPKGKTDDGMIERECRGCGVIFKTTRDKKIFCSEECRLYSDLRRKQNNIANKISKEKKARNK